MRNLKRIVPPWIEKWYDILPYVIMIVYGILRGRSDAEWYISSFAIMYACHWAFWWWRANGEDDEDYEPEPDDPDGPDGRALRLRLDTYRQSIFTPTRS